MFYSNQNKLLTFFKQGKLINNFLKQMGGVVASWLVRWSPDRAVRVRALAADIVVFLHNCLEYWTLWARHLTLTVPLSTQGYKWVPANCWGHLTNCGRVTCDGLAMTAMDPLSLNFFHCTFTPDFSHFVKLTEMKS